MDNVYNTGRFVCHFTSETQAENFNRDRVSFRNELEQSLTNRFKMKVSVTQDFADLVLYHRISKQLFLVEFENATYANMQDIISTIGVANI